MVHGLLKRRMASVSFSRFPPNICSGCCLVSRSEIMKMADWFTAAKKKCTCTDMHCSYYSDIFTIVDSTHLLWGLQSHRNRPKQNYIQLVFYYNQQTVLQCVRLWINDWNKCKCVTHAALKDNSMFPEHSKYQVFFKCFLFFVTRTSRE